MIDQKFLIPRDARPALHSTSGFPHGMLLGIQTPIFHVVVCVTIKKQNGCDYA
jgi:hypothetical protein